MLVGLLISIFSGSAVKHKMFQKYVVLLPDFKPSQRPTKKELVDLNARGLGEKKIDFDISDSVSDVYKKILQ